MLQGPSYIVIEQAQLVGLSPLCIILTVEEFFTPWSLFFYLTPTSIVTEGVVYVDKYSNNFYKKMM